MAKLKIHHKIAGIIIRDKKLLMCRKYDEPHFIMPGGEIEEKETPEQTLRRELKEELGVRVIASRYFRSWDAPHFRDKDKIVRMDVYFVGMSGEPRATSEINEIAWIDSTYKRKGLQLASINSDYLIPELKRLKLIR